MIISIDSEDIVRATRVARMVAKCDCEEKGGNVENHFATILCNNHDQLLEERDRLRELLSRYKFASDNVTKYRYALSYNDSYVGEPTGEMKNNLAELDMVSCRVLQLLNGETK